VADIPATAGIRTIVMTGAADGTAAAALRRIAAHPTSRLIVGARHPASTLPAGIDTVALDLTRCASVYAFAETVTRRLGRTPIDALVLDTGGRPQHTDTCLADAEPGHLAHQLLARLLAAHLADNARVILLSGVTVDCLSRTARVRAYAASRLRDLLPARPTGPATAGKCGITVMAFHPAGAGGRGGKFLARLTTATPPDRAARELREEPRNRHGH
jgi:NAD(P)-dependent dehydrogenase (short-subunit alcohol dehydrogenase family)